MKAILKFATVFLMLFLSNYLFAQRDPLKWPFAKTSIWNMPIHNNAVYVPSQIKLAPNFEVDEDVIIMTPNEPLMNVKTNNTGWSAGGDARCSDQGPTLFSAPIPQSFIFSNSVWHGSTPNAGVAILQPNGSIIQSQPFAKCSPALSTSLYTWDANGCKLTGECTIGAHGGSHLSAIGGAIRVGEFTAGVIPHVLKINLFGKDNFFNGNGGFRWPATTADGGYNVPGAPNYYGGLNTEMRIGALLALDKNASLQSVASNSLGLETEAALIVARALQNYGAYTVDNTAWEAYGLITEIGPNGRTSDEFRNLYGFDMNNYGNANTAWARDIRKIYANLFVISNNGPTTVGGGPTEDSVNRRAPLAPDFLPTQTFRIMPLGDSKTAGGNGNSAWRGFLRTRLLRAGYKIDLVGDQQLVADGDTIPNDPDHSGHGGYTIGPDINRFCPACETTGIFEHVQDYLAVANPDVILLALGVNDMFSEASHAPNYKATAPQRYRELVEKILLLKPNVKIIVGTVEPVKWDVNWGADPNDQALGALNAAIKRLADSSTTDNIFFADIRTKMLIDYSPLDFFDDLHLSARGAKKDANAWFDDLVPVLNNTPNNTPPTISITAPVANATFTAPAGVNINVNAADVDGTINKVEYYNNTIKIGESVTAPYSFTWANVDEGTFFIKAKAIDNYLASAESAPILISVASSDGYIKFTGTGIGTPGSYGNSGSTFIKALDGDTTSYFDGPTPNGHWVGLDLGEGKLVKKVRFVPRANWTLRMVGAKIQGANTADFSDAVDLFTITNPPIYGYYTTGRFSNDILYRYYRFVSPENGYGNVAEIEFWGPNTQGNTPPTCTLTTPFNNSNFYTNANVGLSVKATDADGTIAKVEYYNGNTLIGSVTAAPFNFIWPNVANGSYELKAKAIDNGGLAKVSNLMSIVVSQPGAGTLYSQDFTTNAATDWIVNSGTWAASGQKYASTNSSSEAITFYNPRSFADYTYNVDAVTPGSFFYFTGILFNYTDVNNYYSIEFDVISGIMELRKKIGGVSSLIASATIAGGSGVTQRISITNTGTTTTVKINNIVIFNNISTTQLAQGKIGLYTLFNTASFDNISVVSNNNLPAVAINAPLTNAAYPIGANIPINSTATDVDGTVANVKFYHEDTLIGTANTAPFNLTWLNVPAGDYNVAAVAADNTGGKTTSSTIRVLVGIGNPLPVTLSSFTAQRSGTTNKLTWVTQQESNSSRFVVERSRDGRTFTPIGTVAAAGNSNTSITYYFTDQSPIKARNFYRIRFIDLDNSSKTSDTKVLSNAGLIDVVLSPNPASQQVNIAVYAESIKTVQLFINDLNGRLVESRLLKLSAGSNMFNINSAKWASGIYVLKLQFDDEVIIKKIAKQ